jgi:hypothetical protein
MLGIAYQQVGKAMRILVHHAAYRHPEALVAVAAQILQGRKDPRAMHL